MAHLIVTRIILAHHFVSPPGWYSDEYALSRQYSGLVYVLSGCAEYCMGNGTHFFIREGDCLYVPRNSVYTVRCGESDGFEHMTVNFELSGNNDPFSVPVHSKMHGSVQFEQLFSRLIHCWTIRHPCYHERCMGFLYEMLYLVQAELNTPGHHFAKQLRPARDYLDEHFREDFPLSILPGLCHLSETYFRRLFRLAFNESPAEYRRRLRVAYAQDLLLDARLSISEIAQQCGYPDPAYFSRMFQKTLGICPSRYAAEVFVKGPQDDP